jgi:hypothetical protein
MRLSGLLALSCDHGLALGAKAMLDGVSPAAAERLHYVFHDQLLQPDVEPRPLYRPAWSIQELPHPPQR